MPPLDRVAELEAALVAWAVLMPDAIPRPLAVSHPCALVLDVIFAEDGYSRYGLTAGVRSYVLREPRDVQHAARELADAAADMTVQTLATIGDLGTVLVLLAAEQWTPAVERLEAA